MVEKPVGRRGRPRQREEDMRHLEHHAGKFRVVLQVPRRVRHLVGVARFRQDLGTADLAVAALAKREPLARFQAKIDAALAEIGETQEARELAACRAIMFDYRLHPDRYTPEEIARVEDRLRGLGDMDSDETSHRAKAILDGFGLPLAPASTDTPLAALHDEYLAEQAERLAPSTVLSDREAIRWLLLWLVGERVAPSIEAMTDERIREFSARLPDLADVTPTTAGRMLSRLSAFWRWAGKRGLVAENPWTRLAAELRRNTQSNS